MKPDVPLTQSRNIIDLCLSQPLQCIGVYNSLLNTQKQNKTTCGIKMEFWPSYQNFLRKILKTRLQLSVASFKIC